MTVHASTRRRALAAGAAATLLLLASGCSSDSEEAAPSTTAAEAATTTTAAHAEVHFTYEGEDGPEHWGDLSEEWATCAEGAEQSPIDLTGATEASDADLPDIAFDYQPSTVALLNNGHTVQAVYEPGSSITLAGKTYELKQFHFHAHSEHAVDGETTPLEVHFVHQAEDKSLAVVGVMLVEGKENPAFASVLDNLPAEESEEAVTVDGATVDAAAMLPTDATFFHYDGSLTTPPCSEGVSWQVMTTPVELSAAQIAKFTALYADDARPLQPLGDRDLEVSDS